MKIGVSNVAKSFNNFAAVSGVNLDIRSGELVALLGPSGSGKTTLLRIIAGLEWPDQGQVFFDGDDALARSVGERHVGFVFQHYALFRHLTVFENVAFGLRVRPRGQRLSEAEVQRRVHELLDLVQLRGLEARYPNQLSGGQRQRVALARALAIEPRVLLLDEPFGALDAKVRKELRRWLRGLQENIHVTTVFVTHDQEEALEIADRIVVMDRGHIEQIGTPSDIYERPATGFVHEFIGESIALPVSVKNGVVHFNGKPTGLKGPSASATDARLFIRPDEISIGSDVDAPLRGTIVRSHGIGSRRRIEIALDNSDNAIEVAAGEQVAFAQGATVGLTPKRFRVFETGR